MSIDPTRINDYSNDELVQLRLEAAQTIEEAELDLKYIDERLGESLPMDEQIIGNYVVKKVKRTCFDVDIEKAREYGAIKIVPEKIVPATEAIDTPALHKLAKQGVEIPTKTTTKIDIKPTEQPE